MTVEPVYMSQTELPIHLQTRFASIWNLYQYPRLLLMWSFLQGTMLPNFHAFAVQVACDCHSRYDYQHDCDCDCDSTEVDSVVLQVPHVLSLDFPIAAVSWSRCPTKTWLSHRFWMSNASIWN
jgi:hypothetical protein